MAAKCFCGTPQSRNHASLSLCTSGMPGENTWPGRSSGGSTANLSNGANHDSFSPAHGAPSSRAALHNALRRLNLTGERNSIGTITPEKIKAAFLWKDPL